MGGEDERAGRCRRLIVAVAVTLIAGACADDGTAGSTTTTAPPTTAPPTTVSSTVVSAAPTDPPATHDVEVATINVLHGFPPPVSGCAEDTDRCHAPTRVDILWDLLETEAGCPEIVALQEISPRWFELVPEKLPELCAGDHVLLTEDVGQVDQEMILTTLPVLDDARITLAGGPIWSAHWAQLDAGDGLVVDVFATHYASSSYNPTCAENGLDPCSPACPADLLLGDCHPVQTLEILADRAAPGSLQLVVGDLNAEIDEPRIRTLLDAGFVDTHTLAGNPECPPDGGTGCSSGIGGDTDLDGLDIADQTLRSRIDLVLARAPEGCTVTVDGEDTDDTDTDGDGTTTGLWSDTPLPTPVDGLSWPSDHAGVQADVGLVCS